MTPDPEFDERASQLAGYLAGARWFGGKGRDFEVVSVQSHVLGPNATTNLVGLRYTAADEPGTDLYQLPLSSYDHPQERLQHAAVGYWDGQHHYDAVHDREAMQVWLRAFAGESPEQVRFVTVQEHELDPDAHSTLFSGEQSNSSVAFGEDAMLKVFRRVHPGTNPDIEIHSVLTEAGNTHVAALYGYARPIQSAPKIPFYLIL